MEVNMAKEVLDSVWDQRCKILRENPRPIDMVVYIDTDSLYKLRHDKRMYDSFDVGSSHQNDEKIFGMDIRPVIGAKKLVHVVPKESK